MPEYNDINLKELGAIVLMVFALTILHTILT